MSILFATPAYGSMVTLGYHKSLIQLQESLLQANIAHDFLTIGNESLITRARNTCVKVFMESRYEKLMFIDADIEFQAEDVARLWNLQEEVCCGAYRQKTDCGRLSVWTDTQLTYEDLGETPIPVKYAGTGFLMIDKAVFKEMDAPETENGKAYFDTGVRDGVYLSEDYMFCDRVREMGKQIILEPTIRLKHWGSYGYC